MLDIPVARHPGGLAHLSRHAIIETGAVMQSWEISGNENIFKQWQHIARRVELLSTIVQNDMEISQADFDEFSDASALVCRDISSLRGVTMRYIRPPTKSETL